MNSTATDVSTHRMPQRPRLRATLAAGSLLMAVQFAAPQLLPLQISAAQAQQSGQRAAPGSPRTADRALQLQQQAENWNALPEADRKAVQDSLVWVGLYNGVVDGAFGQRTADAIGAFEKTNLLPAGSVISGPGLAVLRAAANKEKSAVGFALIDDPATGARIGSPSRLFDRRESNPGRTRLSSSKTPASLTLFAGGADDGDLPAWFARATGASTPGRKVTYKILRPDFAVVTGDEGDRRFFTRVAGSPAGLRGFTFVYPIAAAATMDRLTIAIANSFAPFAGQPGAMPASSPASGPAGRNPAGATPGPNIAPVVGSSSLTGSVSPLTGTALLVAPGRAITATAAVRGCKQIRIGEAQATVTASDRQSGLSLLAAPGVTIREAAPLALASAPGAGEALLLAAYVADGGNAPGLTAITAQPGAAPGRIVAALQTGGPGALALDRSGALAGIVAQMSQGPAVNGVKLATSHPLATVADVARMLKDAGQNTDAAPDTATDTTTGVTPPAGSLSTGAAISGWRARLAPVLCLTQG